MIAGRHRVGVFTYGQHTGVPADGGITRVHTHDLGLSPYVAEGFNFCTSRMPVENWSAERVLEPRKSGRRLHGRIMGDFFQVLSLFDTLENLHATTFSTASDQPL